MKLQVLRIGRGKAGWPAQGVQDYARRLRSFGGVDEISLRSEDFRGSEDKVRRAEAERLLKVLVPRDRIVALDERGHALDSIAFSKLLEKARLDAVPRLVFVLGGPYGLHESVRRRAFRVIRLSKLVLNHEVARVVLYEQLYRGFSILQGSPYHH
jgi:23S rRNA (pseudouridine1915-N3)-methyltransferase